MEQRQTQLSEVVGDVQGFLHAVFTELERVKLQPPVDSLFCDHLCYRVATEGDYQLKKQQLAQFGVLLHEATIGGRLVATFKLSEPVAFGNRRIPCMELPAPKAGSPYPPGLEHIELVIEEEFQSFMARNPHLSFDTKAMDKAINPDIQLLLPPYTVKFHHMPLEQVVLLEQQQEEASKNKEAEPAMGI